MNHKEHSRKVMDEVLNWQSAVRGGYQVRHESASAIIQDALASVERETLELVRRIAINNTEKPDPNKTGHIRASFFKDLESIQEVQPGSAAADSSSSENLAGVDVSGANRPGSQASKGLEAGVQQMQTLISDLHRQAFPNARNLNADDQAFIEEMNRLPSAPTQTDKKEDQGIYILREDLERAHAKLDLGENTVVHLYLYPHRETLPHLVQFTSVDSQAPAVAEDRIIQALQELGCDDLLVVRLLRLIADEMDPRTAATRPDTLLESALEDAKLHKERVEGWQAKAAHYKKALQHIARCWAEQGYPEESTEARTARLALESSDVTAKGDK